MAAAEYTHYFTAFLLLAHLAVVTVLMVRGEGRQWRWWVLATAVTLAVFLPWLPIAINQVQQGGGGWVAESVGPPTARTFLMTGSYMVAGPDITAYGSQLRYAALLLAVMVGLGAMVQVDRRVPFLHVDLGTPREATGVMVVLAYALIPIAVVWLISQVKPMYVVRFLLPFLGASYILMGRGIARRGVFMTRSLLLVAMLAFSLWGVWRLAITEQNPDWRGLSATLIQQSQDSDVVLFVPGWNAKPFDYYAHGRLALVSDTPIPMTEEEAQAMANTLSQSYRRIWLVLQDDHYADREGVTRGVLDRRFPRLSTWEVPRVGSISLYEVQP
jgi:hypothetical protein